MPSEGSRENVLAVVCIVVLVAVASFAAYCGEGSQFERQAPRIETNQQPTGAAEGESNPNYQQDNALNARPVVPAIPSSHLNKEGRQDGNEATEEGSEYWPWLIFGFRLKVTDSLLALFTFFLVVVGTWQGYHLNRTVVATNRLWDAGERQIAVWKDAVEKAGESADAARDTAAAVLQANVISRAQIRAFLTIPESPPSQLTQGPNKEFLVKLYIANNGQSLARTVQIDLQVILEKEYGLPIAFQPVVSVINDIGIGRVAEKTMPCGNFGTEWTELFAQEVGINRGIIRVRGLVRYKTIFDDDEIQTEPINFFVPFQPTYKFTVWAPLMRPLGGGPWRTGEPPPGTFDQPRRPPNQSNQ